MELSNEQKRAMLPRVNMGLPTLNLENCSKDAIPSDWDITEVFGDIIMCKYVDENATGEVLRNGIWLSKDISHNLWRIVEVILAGPEAIGINIGDTLLVPGDKGIPGMSKNGVKLLFVNKERIFGKVKPTV
jgi:hypothetical protein